MEKYVEQLVELYKKGTKEFNEGREAIFLAAEQENISRQGLQMAFKKINKIKK